MQFRPSNRAIVHLENQLQRQLNIPRAAAAHEGVADADVGGDGDGEEACAAAGRRID